MIENRSGLPNTDCTKCKYAYNRHCRKGSYILRCSSCEHRAKHKNFLVSDCLCVLSPTKNELKTGKCHYYKEYKEE